MNTPTSPNLGPHTFVTANYPAFPLRLAVIDGSRWFAAADVCQAIGIIDTRHGYSKHLRAVAKEDKRLVKFPQPERGRPSLISISDSGLRRFLKLKEGPRTALLATWLSNFLTAG